jgi:DUF438 domain-containing protein
LKQILIVIIALFSLGAWEKEKEIKEKMSYLLISPPQHSPQEKELNR